MSVLIWYLIWTSIIASMARALAIGQPREPWTPKDVALGILANVIVISILVYFNHGQL